MTAAEKIMRAAQHRARISEAIKQKWKDPEYRNKVSGSLRSNFVQTSRIANYRVSPPNCHNPLDLSAKPANALLLHFAQQLARSCMPNTVLAEGHWVYGHFCEKGTIGPRSLHFDCDVVQQGQFVARTEFCRTDAYITSKSTVPAGRLCSVNRYLC